MSSVLLFVVYMVGPSVGTADFRLWGIDSLKSYSFVVDYVL